MSDLKKHVEVIHYGTGQVGLGNVEDPDHSTTIRFVDEHGEQWVDSPGGVRGAIGNLLSLETEEQAFELLHELGRALAVEIPYDRSEDIPWPGDDYIARHKKTSARWAIRRQSPAFEAQIAKAEESGEQYVYVRRSDLIGALEWAVDTGFHNGFADAVHSLRVAIAGGQLLRRSAANVGRRIVSFFKPGVRVVYEEPRILRRGTKDDPEAWKRYGTVARIDVELTANEYLVVAFDDGEERAINQDVMRRVREGDKDPKAVGNAEPS